MGRKVISEFAGHANATLYSFGGKMGDDEITFEDEVRVTKIFLQQLGWDKAAEFVVHQNETIKGLQKNNDLFVKAYKEQLETKKS